MYYLLMGENETALYRYCYTCIKVPFKAGSIVFSLVVINEVTLKACAAVNKVTVQLDHISSNIESHCNMVTMPTKKI